MQSVTTSSPKISEELLRLESQFLRQRNGLNAEVARFDEWQSTWHQRQRSIDSSLEIIKQQLAQSDWPETVRTLKLVGVGCPEMMTT